MILIMTKYHKNSLRDKPLSLIFIVKSLSSLKTKKVLKIPNGTFLKITRYFLAEIFGHFTPQLASFSHMVSESIDRFQTGGLVGGKAMSECTDLEAGSFTEAA